MSLIATCRQFTGQAWRFRAYVRDTETSKIVAACDHKHRSMWGKPGGKNGEFYAMRCARRMLKKLLAEKANSRRLDDTEKR